MNSFFLTGERGYKIKNLRIMNKEFKINNEIYFEDIVNQAISDFKEVWEIKYNDGMLEINWDSESEIDEIFNEFMNYIIWLINE